MCAATIEPGLDPGGAVLSDVIRAQKDALERIVRGDPLASALADLITSIEDISDSEVAGSVLLLEDGLRLRHCAAPSLPDEYNAAIDGIEIGLGVGSCGTAAFTGAPVIVDDIATDPLWADFRDLALAHDLRACWSTPIIGADNHVLGTFAMYYRQPMGPSETDHLLVDLCVRTAAVAISRAAKEAEDRRTRDRLRLALAAGGLGAWEWDLRRGQITWDPMLESIYGFQPGEFTGDMAAYSERIHPDDRDAHRALVDEARAALRPYETEHRVVHPDGTVRWTHGWAAPRFDEQGLAGYTGVVADVTEQHIARQRLDHVVTTLQRSLLPPVPPEIPGLEVATCYRPALDGLEIGGDFYDFSQTGRNSWVGIIGDVCGKGADAAALTAVVRYAARAAAIRVSSPAKVLQRVNDVMIRDERASEGRFATALVTRVKLVDGGAQVTFASAGHPRPFVVRATGEIERPGRHGELLGVFDSVTVHNANVFLGAGDAFIAVTDGVLEARNAEGVEFGDRMADVLSAIAQETAAGLTAAIEEAALTWGPRRSRDDIAIVALRVPA